MLSLEDALVLLHGKHDHLTGSRKSSQKVKADNMLIRGLYLKTQFTRGAVRGELCSTRRPTATDGIGRRNLSIVGRNCGRKNCRISLNLKPSARLSNIHQGQRSSLCIHNGRGGFYCWSDKSKTQSRHISNNNSPAFPTLCIKNFWASGSREGLREGDVGS